MRRVSDIIAGALRAAPEVKDLAAYGTSAGDRTELHVTYHDGREFLVRIGPVPPNVARVTDEV
jgi:hypothetical protein